MKPYNKKDILIAKILRRNMTVWERKLWYDFLKDYPIRFQRQKAIGNYVVDFYCAKARLVLELEGSGHFSKTQMELDKKRTEDLESMNLHVLRICNTAIDSDFARICEMIDAIVADQCCTTTL